MSAHVFLDKTKKDQTHLTFDKAVSPSAFGEINLIALCEYARSYTYENCKYKSINLIILKSDAHRLITFFLLWGRSTGAFVEHSLQEKAGAFDLFCCRHTALAKKKAKNVSN